QQNHSSGHFSILETVAIENQIRSNISDSLYLGVEIPNVLVTTLAICEIEDAKGDMDRILKGTSRQWSQWRQEDNNNNNNNINSNNISNESLNDKKIINNGIEAMQSKVKQEILNDQWQYIDGDQHVTDDNKDEPVQQFLAKMDNFMEDLQLILPFYIDNYLKILTIPLMNRLDANMVKIQERLSIVSWIDRFKRKIEDLRSKRHICIYVKYKNKTTVISY
ncbi:mannose-6-phosphate receptor domain-containing protein, partial [Reticulomyxa filosa]